MSLNKHQFVFAQNVSKLIAYAFSIGVEVTFGEAYRSQNQQYLYYYGKGLEVKNGELTIVNKKKRSWTLSSKHKKRLAIDLNYFIDGKLTYTHERITKLGEYWQSLNEFNEAGMFWKSKDSPHFQMTK